MEVAIKEEHKGLSLVRFCLALVIGYISSKVWHLCPLESKYIEYFLLVLAMAVFPYLTFKRKTFKWLFLIYTAVMLAVFQYIYITALHRNMIPAFLMTTPNLEPGETYEILQVKDHYKPPENQDEDYIEGHRFGWEVNLLKFSFTPTGEIHTFGDEVIKGFYKDISDKNGYYEKYISREELLEKSDAFKQGMKDGSRAAIKSVKSHSRKLKKEDL